MIGKIESTFPNTKNDIDLSRGDAAHTKEKKAKPIEPAADDAATPETEESLQTSPVHIRHLGRHLDLIG